MTSAYGYQIDHVAEVDRCCEMHNTNCEPPAELCCDDCAEIRHYTHHGSIAALSPGCVLHPCSCTSEQQHIDTTQPGWAGAGIGKREAKPL